MVVVGLFLPLLVLGAIPLQLARPADASPNPVPVMSITLTYSGVTAAPSDYAPGSVADPAQLTIDKIPGERLVVDLTGSTDTGWPVTCVPPNLMMTTNKIVPFTVYIQVPMNTPASSVGVLHVTASGGGGGGLRSAASAEAIVTVAPFYKVFVTSPMPFKEVPPGSTLTFMLDAYNLGNSVDTFYLDINNQGDLADKGWTVSFSTVTVPRIGPMQHKSVRLYVMAPKITTIYKTVATQILVTVHSEGSHDVGQDRNMFMPFIVYERGSYLDLYATGWSLTLLAIILVPTVWFLRWYGLRRKARRAALGETDEAEEEDEGEPSDK
jgi:hypothetical protein